MVDKLLVRVYNVGLGDCIYVQVPDKKGIDGKIHILIDCGNRYGEMSALKAAIENLETLLPVDPKKVNGEKKKRLDLLVVTHPHEDHHKGFEPEYFKNIRIKNLWLSPAFYELAPNAKKKKLTGLRDMQAAVADSLNSLIESSPAGDTKDFLEDVLLSLSTTEEAVRVLTGGEKDGQTLDVEKRRYVSSDFSYDSATFTEKAFKEDLKDLFRGKGTKIKILGPIGNLATYLPKTKTSLKGIQAMATPGAGSDTNKAAANNVFAPRNISIQDFDLLRQGIQGNVLATAGELGHAVNNLSVVLLLEWRGYRLLFPGDAEWESNPIEVKKAEEKIQFKFKLKEANNGSWNVMWNTQDKELSKPVDFLKVGHHGSENATPWAPNKRVKKNGKEQEVPHPISQILDKLLPVSKRPTAQAVVSTFDTTAWPSIPDPALLAEIGKRVSTTNNYWVHVNQEWKKVVQPWRTDRGAKDGPNERPVKPPPGVVLINESTDEVKPPKNKSSEKEPTLPPDQPWIDIVFPAR